MNQNDHLQAMFRQVVAKARTLFLGSWYKGIIDLKPIHGTE